MKESINYLSNAILLNPSYEEALCSRGIAFLKLRRMNDAKKDLEKVIYLNNTNKRAKAGLGEIFLHQGDLEDGLNMMHDFYGFIRFSKNSEHKII